MKIEVGDTTFPIWLLGDSNPKNWQDVLITPLDPRHPARHNIWTPILDVIQDRVFRKNRARVDTTRIYIRNAIEDPKNKPVAAAIYWQKELEQRVTDYHNLIEQYSPLFIFTFGAFAFEFARRSLRENDAYAYGHWGANTIGTEFRQRVKKFDINRVNVIPLLHTSISRGRFLESHNYFFQPNGNYFEFTGNQIADLFLKYSQDLHIWIE